MVSKEIMDDADAQLAEQKPIEKVTGRTVKSMHNEESKIVSPGEILGTEEEFIAGKGTWIDKQGNIHSAVSGRLITDANRQISVVPLNLPPDVHEGSVVYGRIDEMFESVAFISIESLTPGPKRRVMTLSGVIPISEIKDAYVQSIRDEMRVGDIIRAAVSKLTPFRMELTLKPSGMGVIKAFCSYDRQEMKRQGQTVVCSVCGQSESRHLGEPYGEIGPIGDVSLVSKPREPRSSGPREGYDRNGPRGGRGFRGESRGFSGGRSSGSSFGGKRTFRSGSGSGRRPGQAR